MPSKYNPGDTAYIVESGLFVRQVKVVRCAGGFATLRFTDSAGGVRLREADCFRQKRKQKPTSRRSRTLAPNNEISPQATKPVGYVIGLIPVPRYRLGTCKSGHHHDGQSHKNVDVFVLIVISSFFPVRLACRCWDAFFSKKLRNGSARLSAHKLIVNIPDNFGFCGDYFR